MNIYLYLAAMFVALNLMAPIASTKVAIIAGVTFAAGSLLVGVSYGLLDVINDWKGKKEARQTAWAALWVRATFFLIVIPVLMLLPAKNVAPGFDEFLTTSFRLFVAGWVSLWAGAILVNTPIFSELKRKMNGKNFVLRYLVTSFPTILTGAIVYSILGFYGTKVDVWALIWGTTVARVLISIVLAPVVGLIRWGVRYYGESPV